MDVDKSPNVILSKIPWLKTILFRVGLIKDVHMKSWDRTIKYGDARKIRFPEESVDCIYSSHLLEQVFFWEAQEILNSSHKMLRTGGSIRLALPDCKQMLVNFADLIHQDPLEAGLQMNRSLLNYPLIKSDKPWFLLDSFLGHVHKWQPTPEIAEKMLSDAGFTSVTRHKFREGDFLHLKLLEHRSEGTFYIEGRKGAHSVE